MKRDLPLTANCAVWELHSIRRLHGRGRICFPLVGFERKEDGQELAYIYSRENEAEARQISLPETSLLRADA